MNPRFFTPLAFAIILFPMLAIIATHWSLTPLIGGPDPDAWLRLTLVRDWLSGGSWYDHTMLHSNAPWVGISSPWTRPLDVVLALITEIQPTSIDLSTRLLRAALIVPALWYALLLLGLLRATRALAPQVNASLVTALLLVTSLAMWSYYNVANADHHGLLAALFINAVAGLLRPAPSTRTVLLSGFLFGLQLWISPEALVLIGAVYAWFGLQWLRGEHSKLLPHLSTTIAATSIVAVMIERPVTNWFTPIYDSISIVYVFLLTVTALLCWMLYLKRPATYTLRILFGMLAAAALVGSIAWAYPLMLHGPMAEVDPYIFTHFLPAIHESHPAYTQPLRILVSSLLQPLLLLELLARLKPRMLQNQGFALFLFAVTGTLYLSQYRFFYYWQPVIILMLAPLLTSLFTRLIPRRAVAILCATMLGPIALLLNIPAPETLNQKQVHACATTAREWMQTGALTNIDNGKSLTLLADTNLGGELLFWTPHRIIASNYHREGAGIRYVWESQAITDATKLRRYLAERKVDALLICPWKTEELTEGSILQGLQRGERAPHWLRRVAMPTAQNPMQGAEPALFLVQHESGL